MNTVGKPALWIGRVVSVLGVLIFISSGLMKFSGSPEVAQGFEHFGWPSSLITTVAILELGSAALYLLPPFSFLGAILLTGYIGGAMATHLRLQEPVYMHVLLGILIWFGLFLREPRLRVLLPVRGRDRIHSREIIIDRPAAEVFAYLRSLKNFSAWNPFAKADPQLRPQFKGSDGAVGSQMSWDGNKMVGAGEQEITRIVDGERIEFELRFLRPFASTTTGSFAVAPAGSGQTKVIWSMLGKTAFPMTILCLVFSTEKMIGGQFENGLKELKKLLEKK